VVSWRPRAHRDAAHRTRSGRYANRFRRCPSARDDVADCRGRGGIQDNPLRVASDERRRCWHPPLCRL